MSVSTRCVSCGGQNGWHRMDCEQAHRYPQTVTMPPDAQAAEMVHDPPHYTSGEVETMDAIDAALGPLRFEGYCIGQCLKYLWRYRRKGRPLQDLQKAQWYLDRALSIRQSGGLE